MENENPISSETVETVETIEPPTIEPAPTDPATLEPVESEAPGEQSAVVDSSPAETVDLLPDNPQLFSTSYITDDYVITLVHDMTLGDVLIATLLCVLIIIQLLKSLIGGARW